MKELLPSDLAALARKINALGLRVPVIALLEMHKPLAGLLHSGALFAQPSLALLFGRSFPDMLLRCFESKENMEGLIKLLEDEDALREV